MNTPAKKHSSIRPVEFYGNGLPRPRFFENPQFNSHRVDPPLSVLDPLLSWARDAHWSMGGVNFTRLRLQGRIEGNCNKLRAQLEHSTPVKHEDKNTKKKRSGSESPPPPTPIVVKRRRYLDLNDDGSDDEGVVRIRRKLSDYFDRVADENETKSVKAKPVKKSIEPEIPSAKKLKEKKKSSTRTSPRLAKR